MNDLAGLQALVEDVGSGNVIDAELLDGCPVEAHELDEMDASQAAQVAAHCFGLLFDHKVEQLKGIEADLDAGLWTCLLYTSPSPRDKRQSRMPSSA